jgi:DNA polymerase-1
MGGWLPSRPRGADELEGWEADDLIGTISRRCEAAGWDCVAATGDKDSLQLITEHTKVKLVSTRMGQTLTEDMTPDAFREKYGFDPIHMIDLKALMGDSSDNIPGVPGVGEKTASALIQEYGSIDAIYKAMPDVHAKPAALKNWRRARTAPAIPTGWPPSSPTRRWTSVRRTIC